MLARILRALLSIGIAICLLTTGLAWVTALERPHSLELWSDGRHLALVVSLGACLLVECGAAVMLLRRWRTSDELAWRVRWLVSGGVLGAIGYLTTAVVFKALWLVLYAGLVGGVLAGLLWLGPMLRVPRRLTRALDHALFVLALVVIGLEVGLRSVARFSGSAVFGSASTPQAQLARFRFAPGQLHYGFPCNARGYADDVPVRDPGRALVACIGDSFSHGIVPHEFHYTTVCERLAQGIDVYNIGVTTTGPAEYLLMLEQDALPLRPHAIVISLFVGNDVHDALRFRADRALLRRVFDPERFQLVGVPTRLFKLWAERARRGGEAVGRVQGESASNQAMRDRDRLVVRYPWLEDPSLEVATFSEQAYRDAQYTRIVAACGPDADRAYDALFAALDRMRELARGTRLFVMLIPDEFQVEDRVWQAALHARSGAPAFERDLPQRRIGAWLDAAGIRYLDLLPQLRAVPALADGDRHLYHLRDTHFNARGNLFAGRALATFLEAQLE